MNKHLVIPNVYFEIPEKIILTKMTLEVLSSKHNEIDFEAWNSSKDSLKGIFGPLNKWPEEVNSLEQNLRDLENHYKEFTDKVAYTYSILKPDESICLGCLYIRPSKNKKLDCRVDFWFRDSHKDLELKFYSWLQEWLKDEWGLKNVAYPGRSISWDEYYEIMDE